MDKETNTEPDYVLANGQDGATPVPQAAEIDKQKMHALSQAEAVPVDMYMMPPKKEGHKCCGGCCDMRRATMIVNFINIGFILLGFWYLIAYAAVKRTARAVDDDEMQEMYSEMEELKGVGAIVAVMLVRLMCNSCGVYGAYSFNMYLVGISLAGYCLETVFALISFNLGGLFMAIFFAYPHVFLIKEIRAGIMTKENYPVEEQSCCCV